MTKDQILNDCLKSILTYVDHNEFPDKKEIIKLILEIYALAMQINLLKEINKREIECLKKVKNKN